MRITITLILLLFLFASCGRDFYKSGQLYVPDENITGIQAYGMVGYNSIQILASCSVSKNMTMYGNFYGVYDRINPASNVITNYYKEGFDAGVGFIHKNKNIQSRSVFSFVTGIGQGFGATLYENGLGPGSSYQVNFQKKMGVYNRIFIQPNLSIRSRNDKFLTKLSLRTNLLHIRRSIIENYYDSYKKYSTDTLKQKSLALLEPAITLEHKYDHLFTFYLQLIVPVSLGPAAKYYKPYEQVVGFSPSLIVGVRVSVNDLILKYKNY
jgi:hypothetical protein